MVTDLRQFIQSKKLSAGEIATKTHEIYAESLRDSRYLDEGNFNSIHPDDLRRLFDLYDELFFNNGCRRLLGDTPLSFRLSKRMTQAGGKATRMERRDRRGKTVDVKYEIAVSTTLLFQAFDDDHRAVLMSGIECNDRLEALQRVIEHEMTHLVEMMIWIKSSCSAPRFQSIANRFFGHTEHRHSLITPREKAFTKFGVKTGDRVSFRFDGRHHVGFVNRITKRATVLVEDAKGPRYSDGKHYRKYYVPVELLKTIDEPQ